MRSPRPPGLRRLALGASAAVALGGLVLFGHAAVRRGALGRVGCPVSASASPEQAEAFRARVLGPLRGAGLAPSRSAFGLTLGATSRAEVSAWAARRGAACVAEPRANALRCGGGAAEGSAPEDGALQDVHAVFDPAGVLVALDVMREGAPGETAARRFDEARARLASALGPPSASWGEPTAAYLGAQPLRQAAAQFRFADFAADLTATNVAARGVVLREQYRAIPAGPEGG